MPLATPYSVYERYRALYAGVQTGLTGPEILDLLLPNDSPLDDEKVLWDYKSSVNVRTQSDIVSQQAELLKDVIAFYNTYGGYIVVGVRDQPREIIGTNETIDVDSLNRQLKSATRHSVDTHYQIHMRADKKVGLLFVPQRPDSLPPAQFLKDAPQRSDGKRAYSRNAIYFRDGDECKPVQHAEDYQFLCSQGKRRLAQERYALPTSLIANNLGPPDPGFIRFIGREENLKDLWAWFCDRFNPVKLLSGLGGVGKTTLSREFAAQIIRASPMGVQNVIWLSAKRRLYSPLQAAYHPAPRVDYEDTISLLRAVLLEVAYNEKDIDNAWGLEEFRDEVVEALRTIPSFLVIDDVDSLGITEQLEVFQTIVQILAHTATTQNHPSKALLTARLTLDSAPGQRMVIRGLSEKDFYDYVCMTMESLGAAFKLARSNKLMQRFWRYTDGSPTFAGAVLRLVSLGEDLNSALEKYKKSDGEAVRRHAFKKELDGLADSQVRTLYAMTVLEETSFVELGQVLQSNDALLRDDLAMLQRYHLIAQKAPVAEGGARLGVPSNIAAMVGLFEERVFDRTRIRNECRKLRRGAPEVGREVAGIIHRVVALWRAEEREGALYAAQWAAKRYPSHADVHCLLGRAYLRCEPPDAGRADIALKKAFGLGCARSELFDLWIEARKIREDWVGVIEITGLASARENAANLVYARAEAYLELGEASRNAGRFKQAADYFLQGGREVDVAFKDDKAYGRVKELKDIRNVLLHSYVFMKADVIKDPNEDVEVWLAAVDAYDCYVRTESVVVLGVDRLCAWWRAVERRENMEQRTVNLGRVQLEKLDEMLGGLQRYRWFNMHMYEYIGAKRNGFAERLTEYESRLADTE
jgi:hypothetical protein